MMESVEQIKQSQELYHICFISRRYKGFEFGSKFMDWIRTQYFWILQDGQCCIRATFIFGSDVDKKVETELGTVLFVKDSIRNHVLNHNYHFYKSSSKFINDLHPDVTVFHGLSDILSHFFLKNKINIHCKTIIQDHGNVYFPKYKLLSNSFAKFDHFLFNSPGQQEAWVSSRTLPENKISFVPEGSSFFKTLNKDNARVATNLKGSPLLLWIGNLDENKDPLTILNAINELKVDFPEIRIYFIYRREHLLKEVQQYVHENNLAEHVVLLGPKKHEEIEMYLNSAEYFILGSAKEGSGYAVIEAMACNVIPILSDIPSFRDFTNNGNIGTLFKRGDHLDLVLQASKLFEKNLSVQTAAVNEYFELNYAPTALGEKLIAVCDRLMES